MANIFRKTKYARRYKPLDNKPSVKEGSWIKCSICGETVHKDDFFNNNSICTKCEQYSRLDSESRMNMVLDTNSFVELFDDVQTKNPLDFPDYEEKIQSVQEKSGLALACSIIR